MKKTYVYMFVDALGWEIVSKYNFMQAQLPYRNKVEMQFGYSSSAVPTILSGESPDKHGHFSFFYYSPKTSPFKKFKYRFYFVCPLRSKSCCPISMIFFNLCDIPGFDIEVTDTWVNCVSE